MSQPFIGEIRLVGFNFPANGWALCDGQLMSIAEIPALFDLIGTTYGGDGVNTFALPNLQGRVPIHQGAGFVQGQSAGSETVSLTSGQVAAHIHSFQGTTAAGTSTTPTTSSVPGAVATATEPIYSTSAPNVTMASTNATGSGQPHDNLMPFQCVNFIISLFGIFPSQN